MHDHRFDDLTQTLTPSQRAESSAATLDRLARAIGGDPLPRRRALKGVSSLALAALLGRLAVPEPARAASQQTATCNPPPSSTNNATLLVTGDDRVAQTFVPDLGGKLSQVDLKISVNAETRGDLVVQIAAVNASGTPTNRILASTTVPSAALPIGTPAFVAARFRRRRAAKVVAGTPYAIIVQRQGVRTSLCPFAMTTLAQWVTSLGAGRRRARSRCSRSAPTSSSPPSSAMRERPHPAPRHHICGTAHARRRGEDPSIDGLGAERLWSVPTSRRKESTT